MTEHDAPQYVRLIEAAFRQTLARFDEEVRRGERNPAAELATYRRRRRDYATALRIDRVPDEARELAERLLAAHGMTPGPAARKTFERDVLRMLVRLYDAFAERAQGSR